MCLNRFGAQNMYSVRLKIGEAEADSGDADAED
jgi:hypothetical protein